MDVPLTEMLPLQLLSLLVQDIWVSIWCCILWPLYQVSKKKFQTKVLGVYVISYNIRMFKTCLSLAQDLPNLPNYNTLPRSICLWTWANWREATVTVRTCKPHIREIMPEPWQITQCKKTNVHRHQDLFKVVCLSFCLIIYCNIGVTANREKETQASFNPLSNVLNPLPVQPGLWWEAFELKLYKPIQCKWNGDDL